MAAIISAGKLADLGTPLGYGNLPPSVAHWADYVPAHYDVQPDAVWATQPSVRKVVDFIARAIASTPIKVYRRVSDTDRQRVTDHPLDRMLRLPSAGVTPYRFWHSLVCDWLIYDRWFALKAATGLSDRPFDLVRIQASRIGFNDDGFGRVRGVNVDGGRRTLDDSRAWLLDHGYAPLGANGVTPMSTLQHILGESREAIDFRRSVWRNGARVATVIKRPADAPRWSPEARDRFVDGWRAYASDGAKSGGSPILEDGMTVEKIDAFSPRDTQDIEGRQLNDVEVCSAYHIAPELVGARQGNYSNVQAFAEMLYGPALGPYFIALEQTLNAMLVPDLDDSGELYVEFDVDAKLRGTFDQQAAVLSAAVGGPWMTRSEARARTNLPEIPDASGLIVPLNVLIGGQASPLDSGTQNERPLAAAAVARHLKRQAAHLATSGRNDADRWRRELADDLVDVLGRERAEAVAQAVNASVAAQINAVGIEQAGPVFESWLRELEGAAC